LNKELKRISSLKQGGLSAYADNANVHATLLEVVEELAQLGVFLVPVGELEGWFPNLQIVEESKLLVAAEIAAEIRRTEEPSGGIWEFTERVLDYLTEQHKACGSKLPVEDRPSAGA
jgi:hypothetical protein